MKTIWDVPGCPGVALHSGRVFNQYGVPHAHAEYEIGLLHGGEGRCFYRRAYHITPSASLIAFQSGEAHAGHLTSTTGTLTRTFLYITPAAFQAVAKDVNYLLPGTPYFPHLLMPTYTGAFRHLWCALPLATSDLERQTLVHDFVRGMLWQTTRPPAVRLPSRERALARKVRLHLEDRFAENISLADLQQLTQVNRDYLLEVFRQTYGEPPHRYLIHVRLERAKDLLRQRLSIAYVAHLTGFTDQAHLTRHFRTYLGYTPGWFVRQSVSRVDPENVQELHNASAP